jgi:glycine cleavage system regulatory protein
VRGRSGSIACQVCSRRSDAGLASAFRTSDRARSNLGPGVPLRRAEALVADLTALKDIGLLVALERTDVPAEHPSLRLNLELLGADHPGIVAEISAALASQRIGIEELSTDVREAPMSGGMLFEARAVLEAPPATSMDELRSMLEAIADELMVEIRLSDAENTDTT